MALLAGLSGACGQELKPNELGWRVGFVCDADRAETQTLLLRVLAGGCEQGGESLYEAKLTRGEDPPEVGRIGSGSFGIEAVAYADEQVIAETCVEVTLPRSEAIALKLRSPSCTTESLDPIVFLDAAIDAGSETDAATAFDAQSATDAQSTTDAQSAIDAHSATDAQSAIDAQSARDADVIDAKSDACASGCSDADPCPDGCGTCTTADDCGTCGRTCSSGASCQNGACKPGNANTCTAHRYAGHDYLVCVDMLNWSAARDRCRGFGMVLVAIDDQSENDFLRDRLGGAPRWIGANDLGPTGSNCRLSGDEGYWHWTSSTSDDGTPFCTAAASGPVSCAPVGGRYQNWHFGEPNNGCRSCTTNCGEGQDCASIDLPGTWDDDYCSSSFGYICETP